MKEKHFHKEPKRLGAEKKRPEARNGNCGSASAPNAGKASEAALGRESAHQGCAPSAECCACGRHCRKENSNADAIGLIIAAAALAAGFAASFFAEKIPYFPLTDPSWIAVFICATPIYLEAWSAFRKEGKITSPMLVSVAISAALGLQVLEFFQAHGKYYSPESYVFAAGEIAFLMGLGEWLEKLTVKRSRAGIERLVSLAPRKARRKVPGGIEEIDASDIKIGDTLVVRPNDMVPIDGVIASGDTSIDQSNMTGEHTPVDKFPGDEVLGGTWNMSKAIEVRATKLASDTAIAKLINLVEEAEGKRAPISKVADKWAGYVVPSAVALAAATFLISTIFFGVEPTAALIRAVTILVVFCPCAFVLATPTAVAAGLGNAAKNGVLIKSAETLERLAKTDTVFFDKTGTLTEGSISVCGVYPVECDELSLLSIAASAENYSEHPIAKAICKAAKERGAALLETEHTTSIAGAGVSASVCGKKVTVGRWEHACAQSKGLECLQAAREKSAAAGESFIVVCADGKAIGGISLSDTLRSDAKETVGRLNSMGYSTSMLTGDSRASAEAVGKLAGIKNIRPNLMPEDKAKAVIEAQNSGSRVCMVGDGVNDAPALAYADCSIAVAALGSDAAIEAAQVSLMGKDLFKVCAVLSLSKAVMRTIKTNITFSIVVNLSAVLLGIFGILTPVSGALVHNATSVAVVLNSARLLGRKKDYQ